MGFAKLIFVVVALSFCDSAAACLNDSELPDREREFRSQYLDNQFMTSQDAVPVNASAWMMSATGFTLLAGAVGLTWFSRRYSTS